MKKFLFPALLLFAINACNQKTTESAGNYPNKRENFDWLIGNWKQLNENTKSETFEFWSKISETQYAGHGFVMSGKDTTWQEKMDLSLSDSTWTMTIVTPGNEDMVKFDMTTYSDSTFNVENPKHDFPKLIKYWKTKDKLNASVSGEGKEIPFEFSRL
jgi:hypothetical protein